MCYLWFGCPPCVLHRKGDPDARPDEGRYIADPIPGGRFVELEVTTTSP